MTNMKTYTFVQPGEDGITPEWITLSEDQIIDEYWNYWSGQMKKVGKESEINRENCIYDYCVVHWATEDKEEC